jgi:3-dehydroquinate synthetase
MSRDKKALEARPRFVLLDRLGHAREENGEYVRAVNPRVVEKVLAVLRSTARS